MKERFLARKVACKLPLCAYAKLIEELKTSSLCVTELEGIIIMSGVGD